MNLTDAARVAAARRWYRRQGHAVVEDGAIVAVATPARPDTWETNWLQAGAGAAPAAMFEALERYFARSSQVVVVDALTPPAIEATLALNGFEPRVTAIEMLAAAPAVSPRPLPPIEVEQVDAGNWRHLVALVDRDLAEGLRTGALDASVAAGLIEAMAARQDSCAYWLMRADGELAGYGMTVACPNGLGLIESLFTVPEQRGRGLMSAFIVAVDARLRAAGCDGVFLDAHVHDTPKHLYARLGFVPVAVTRTWVRRAR